MKKIDVRKYKGLESSITEDVVIKEYKYTLFVNGKKEFVFTCLDSQIKEMAMGYLYTEKKISKLDDVLLFEIKQGNIFTTLKKFESEPSSKKQLTYKLQSIYKNFHDFIESSNLHKQTGAVHSMAIADEEKIWVQIDDLSRHTTLDKLIGFCLLNNIALNDKVLLSTCRITQSIAKKIAATEISVLLSKAAVTEQAIQICTEQQIALVGFIKANSLNVYTFPERII